MKIVFLMPQGAVEWVVPDEQRATFSFQTLVANIRGAGYFMSGDIYLRHDAMIGIVNDRHAIQPFFPQTQGTA